MKCTSYNDTNEVVDKLFDSLRSRYQWNLKRSDFIFNLVKLMDHKCHKVNFRPSGLYIDSPDWIKKKKNIKSKKWRL